jgi:DNA polymerase III subunit epsilon
MYSFVTIDVETANPDMASICQIGIAKYEEGILADEWLSFVNPKDYFDPVNISVHGITEEDVVKAPSFPDIYDEITQFIDNNVLVSHTHFDRVSIMQTINRYDLDQLNITWLDSARVARRTWKEFAWRGYGLKNVCNYIGYDFFHHNALEDAKACGQIVLAACDLTGNNIIDWLSRVEAPLYADRPCRSAVDKLDGNPNGHLFGEELVFTGSLSISRSEAAFKASELGCNIKNNVSKKTTLLVVGNQDINRLNGNSISTKHKKALELIKDGINIRIMTENDFIQMFNSQSSCA